MDIYPSYYSGRPLPKTIKEKGKSLLGPAFLVLIIVLVFWTLTKWQMGSQFFGFSPYKTVRLIDLLSYGNLYDGKRVCTRGYYVDTINYTILKVSLADSELSRSAWVSDLENREIITRVPGKDRAIIAEICGYFQSKRGSEFGRAPFWNHQIIVEKYETFGDTIPLN